MRALFVLLVLLATPALATPLVIPAQSSWHLQLDGPLRQPHRQVYIIDLFDHSATRIAHLKARGHIVLCYFSAGTWEDWRADAGQFPTDSLGLPLADWPGERWLDYRHPQVRTVLAARLDLARDKGCDGVDPDNVDGYANRNGLALTRSEQLLFNRWLAEQAHARDLAVGLKNAVELLDELHDAFDFAVNESCYRYSECAAYQLMRSQGKPVFIAEYRPYSRTLCRQARQAGYQLQFFRRNLRGIGRACR